MRPSASPFGSLGLPGFLFFFPWLKASKLLHDCCSHRFYYGNKCITTFRLCQVFVCYNKTNSEGHAVDNEQNLQNTNPKTTELNEPWRFRLISYIERKLHDRKAEKKEEGPADRAARRTANATVWIAVFTVVLAVVGGFTLIEVIIGGSDTHDLAVAARSQAELARQQAVALQQAVVRIQINNGDFVLISPGLQPAVSLGLRNEGIATATRVSFQGMLAWKAEPRHDTIGQPVPINIEIRL